MRQNERPEHAPLLALHWKTSWNGERKFRGNRMTLTPQRLLVGFIAAALSVLVFHQGMILILKLTGMLPPTATPWSIAGNQIGVPLIINQMFWGGLWGALFAALWEQIPGPNPLAKGVLAGVVGPTILGGWILVPLIKGGVMFAGLDPRRMLISVLINALAFGLGFGFFFPMLRQRVAVA
jgi:hypothetical protein